jgi:secondary thiamine-phosphate synthase enzyme
VREFQVQTERKTQLVNVTEEVREALDGDGEAAAALVYVPHTTAAITINEHVDPRLMDDFEAALARIVDDDWSWRHIDRDGRNGPSHVRASMLGPQVLIPVRDGDLALGRYQGIFLCEFDGPRTRSVYVSPLR